MKIEIWGPPVWTLFHVLATKINENDYTRLIPQLFGLIKRICNFLPCPDCAEHATRFLASVTSSQIDTKRKFINMLYVFHNMVNTRKSKPLFNYDKINNYNNIPIMPALYNFTAVYNTKGNMKLLAEAFQRQLVIKDLKVFIINNINSFK